MPIRAVKPAAVDAPETDRLAELAADAGRERRTVAAALAAAAAAEGLEPGIRLLERIPLEDLRGLIAYVRELPEAAGLEHWRRAWPTVLGPLSDAEASMLIRLAVQLAGGVIIEPDGAERQVAPPPAAPAARIARLVEND